jgi:type III restriction enzyme
MKLGYDISQETVEKIEKVLDKKDVIAFKHTIAIMKNQVINRSPYEKGETFEVPQLRLFIDGEWELAEKEFFLPNGWRLTDYPAVLNEGEFYIKDDGRSVEIDIDGKKITERYFQNTLALDLDNVETNWTNLDLSRWLDRKIYQPDITQPVKLEFLRRVVEYLTLQKSISLSTLIMRKFLLVKALENKINKYRHEAAAKGYQATFFGNTVPVETSFDFTFKFSSSYPAREKYKGSRKFSKHFYQIISDMNGEEVDCASAIDSLDDVKYWVRNIERYYDESFSLPTSTDRFYPDFVAVLNDGRLFAIEYKGDHIATSDDSKEKDNIGKLWEEKSNGTCLFLMVYKEDSQGRNVYKQIKDKIQK